MRRLAREIAVQTLYEVEQSDATWPQALRANLERREGSDDVRRYAHRLLETIENQRDAIQSRIRGALENWTWERVALVDRCVLQVSTAELVSFTDVPVRVSIDEAVAIAKKFSTDESGRFVNGVLDRIARDIEPAPQAPADRSEADA